MRLTAKACADLKRCWLTPRRGGFVSLGLFPISQRPVSSGAAKAPPQVLPGPRAPLSGMGTAAETPVLDGWAPLSNADRAQPGPRCLYRACHAGPDPGAHPRAGLRARRVRPRKGVQSEATGLPRPGKWGSRLREAPSPPPLPPPPPVPRLRRLPSRVKETLREEGRSLLGRRRTWHKGSEKRKMRGVGGRGAARGRGRSLRIKKGIKVLLLE